MEGQGWAGSFGEISLCCCTVCLYWGLVRRRQGWACSFWMISVCFWVVCLYWGLVEGDMDGLAVLVKF